jgi:hypothetical protein
LGLKKPHIGTVFTKNRNKILLSIREKSDGKAHYEGVEDPSDVGCCAEE